MTQSLPPDDEPQQLALDFTTDRWPRKPYCADAPISSQKVRPLGKARQWPNIQPNHPSILWRLPFDVDRTSAAGDWYDAGAPAPSVVVQNPDNGHAHLLYEIDVPVSRDGDTPAVRLAAAVEHGLAQRLGADPDYAGQLVHTPGHERWRTTEWAGLYDLGELAEYLPTINDRCWWDRRYRIPDDHPLGRNCALFQGLRGWSYRAVRDYWRPDGEPTWMRAVLAKAHEINASFRVPLPSSEVEHTAKSVGRWTWTRFSPQKFRESQSRKGKKGGRPRTTTATELPWEKEGVSRATWYRKYR